MLTSASLVSILNEYLLAHRVSAGAAYQLRRSLALFRSYLDREPTIADFRPDLVSDWLRGLEPDYSLRTIKGHRANLLTLWRDAAASGCVDYPFRVRVYRSPRPNPAAWTPAELRQLLAACALTIGRLPVGASESRKRAKNREHSGPPVADYFAAIIRAAYETGLRFSDLIELRRKDFHATGAISIVQRKTGDQHTARLTAATLGIVLDLPGDKPLAWPLARSSFYREFDRIRTAAGVRKIGAMHAIRRTGATQVAIVSPDKVQRFLGHRTPGCQVHYVDRSQIPAAAVEPPAIF